MLLKNIIYTVILLLTLFSCRTDVRKENIPDVSDIEVDIDIHRFDQKVMSMDTSDIRRSYEELLKQHPYMTDLYFKQLLAIPHEDQDSFYMHIKRYLIAEPIIKLDDTITTIIPALEDIREDLTLAVRYLKYYFPEYDIPHFYTIQTEFGYQNVIFSDGDKDGIAIGLDFFLGEDFNYKLIDPHNPSFSDYIARTYNQDHIVKKSFDVIVDDTAGEAPPGKRFIDQMIHNGRKMYIMDRLLPHLPDTVVMEFSNAEWTWLNDNELEIWSFFLDNELMYETNQFRIVKYLNPAPHSPGMPAQAPGKTASFTGLKIVESYMHQYPEISLDELLEIQDMQEFLELSKYKPRRR